MNPSKQPEAIVAQFIIEVRGRGPFLSVDEYSVINRWLSINHDLDYLLLTLSDIFESEAEKGQNAAGKPLGYYEKMVCKRLRDRLVART